MNKLVQGIVTPILTPMYEDESINYEELRNQVNRLIDAGVTGLFCFGTNGESYIISEEEKYAVLQTVIEENKGRVKIYAGTGCPGTKDTIRISLKAKELGADILSIICPYFAAANQNEIYAHYSSIAQAVDLPIVVYNIPPRTGNMVAPDTIGRLAHDFKNIVGIKDSSGNFLNMQQYIEKTRDLNDFSVLSGNDALIFDNLVNGGAGAIAGCSNIYPKTICDIVKRYREGKLDEALALQRSLVSLRDTFKYGNPNTMIKYATNLLGYPVGACRAPFNSISEEGRAAISKVINDNKKTGLQ
ncbi:MAG: 4-hydroxy-tetrahydrodipicolinate synthase [Lachnospiraceae bacterium]|nr:4-hydroxy-tetrahydrodipicolinate synthase [Lachnospiraceae bacterium]